MAKTTPEVKPSPAAREVIAVPSDRAWFDPRLILATLYTRFSIFQPTIPGEVNVALPANPTRVMLTVHSVGAGGMLYPGTIDPSVGWALVSNTRYKFSLFEDGPLVMGEWYWENAAGSYLYVIETLRS